jgi:hypothetical protein
MLGLQLHQRLVRRHRSNDRARLAAAKRRQPVDLDFEGAPPHLPEQQSDLARDRVVDITDEAQSDVVVVGINPARPGDASAQRRE